MGLRAAASRRVSRWQVPLVLDEAQDAGVVERVVDDRVRRAYGDTMTAGTRKP